MTTTRSNKKSLMKTLAFLGVMVLPIINISSQTNQTAFANTVSSQGIVTANDLNVRQAADISSKIIGLVHQGDTFNILQAKNHWDQIKLLNNQTGWVYNAYMAPAEDIKATAKANLRVHKNPNILSEDTGILKSGTKITIQGEKAGWAKIVSASGVQGWAYEYYLSKDTVAQTQDPTPKMTEKTDAPKKVNSPQSTKAVSNAQTSQSIINSVKDLKGKTIVLDPGHGGKDDGTTSLNGTHEKTLTLATAEAVKQKLEDAGAIVYMTRSSDEDILLNKRADLSNQNHADAFISFHYNWSSDPSVSGLTDFYYQKSKDNTLALDLLAEVAKSTKLNNIGTRFDDLSVLRNNLQPSTLIELGFVSNKQEDATVESSAYRNHVAQGVYLGLIDYFSKK